MVLQDIQQGCFLALDTSSDMLSVCIAEVTAEGFKALAVKDHLCRRRANQELVDTCQRALDEAGLALDDLDGFIVGRGPGSFTGVRIGIATAKGLAAGSNKPLYGSSTLDAAAYKAWQVGVRGQLVVVADAMRKEIYPGRYRLDDDGVVRLFTSETVIKVDDYLQGLSEMPEALSATYTGDGLVKYLDKFQQAGIDRFAPEDSWYPGSEGLVYSVTHASMDPQPGNGDAALVLPIYTRLSDAEETERKKLGIQTPDTLSTTGCADQLADIHLQLRPMSINDIDQVIQVETTCFEGSHHVPWSRKSFLGEFQAEGRIWWVAHDRGTIIGIAGGRMAGDVCEILDVAVMPDRRKQGIAERLVRRVAYDAQMLNAQGLTLEVDEENLAASKLYAKLGFKEAGRRVGYYGPGTVAVVMNCPLPLRQDHAAAHRLPDPTGELRQYKQALAQRQKEPTPEVLKEQGALILAMESSCDETAMAVINESGEILSSIVATQIDFHSRFGGVVPEIASRKHTEALVGVFEEALLKAGEHLGLSTLTPRDLSAVACTTGPGLVGALVVGLAFAKGVCFTQSIPLISVNHLEGHLYANLFEAPDLKPPFIASLVSGGNTMLVLVKDWGDYQVIGATIDDAVGEAFDKVAKALGLGYPGGPVISKLAQGGNPKAIQFPRAMMHSHDYRFSLSGLKTSVITYIQKQNAQGIPINLSDLAASFQAAVVDVQVKKAKDAVREWGVKDFCVGGGVSANPYLRKSYFEAFKPKGVRVTVPPLQVCGDNAAMIALVGLRKYQQEDFADLGCDADPNLPLPGTEA